MATDRRFDTWQEIMAKPKCGKPGTDATYLAKILWWYNFEDAKIFSGLE